MLSIRALESTDSLAAFDSDKEELNRFLKKYAARNQYHLHIGVTYVALENEAIVGFVTIAPGSIQADQLPGRQSKKLPNYPLPILRLARLAVTRTHVKRGVGSALVRFVFVKAMELDKPFGCLGVVVDPKKDSVDFYAKLGFLPLVTLEGEQRGEGKPSPMFIHIDTLRAAI